MKTKLEIIKELKVEHPKIIVGSDEDGYKELSLDKYETTIANWAGEIFDTNAKIDAEIQNQIDKTALLNKMGITAAEAKLLLS
jgi:hypothetical protein